VFDLAKAFEKPPETVKNDGAPQGGKYEISDTQKAPWEGSERIDTGGGTKDNPFVPPKSTEPPWERDRPSSGGLSTLEGQDVGEKIPPKDDGPYGIPESRLPRWEPVQPSYGELSTLEGQDVGEKIPPRDNPGKEGNEMRPIDGSEIEKLPDKLPDPRRYDDNSVTMENHAPDNNLSQRTGGEGDTFKPSELIKNKEDGLRRESEVEKELKEKYPESEGYKIEKEVYLRDKDGKIVKDPVTGEARRIDFVVTKDGKVVDSIEVTSKTADKTDQMDKEQRIREAGGNYIKDSNGNLVEIPSDVQTRIERRN
jgi:hypothetical protein